MNHNGNGKPIEAEATTAEALYYVYHEEERHALQAMGFDVATARDFKPAGRHVVIMAGTGDFYAVAKAPEDGEFAFKQGAASVKVSRVPSMRGADLVKLLASGVLDREWIEAEAREADPLTYTPPSPLGTDGRINWAAFTDEELGMRLASDIEAKPIEWLWPERIPSLAYTLIAGEGKQGKSQLTMAIGALLSTGGEWWDECGQAPKGHVLYLSAEDDAERVLRPRLEAVGADLSNVTIMEAGFKKTLADGETVIDGVAELGRRDYWRAVFSRVKDRHPIAIFVDPLPSYIGSGVNDRRNSEVRAVIGPFTALAVEFGMTVIGITHLGKSVNPGKPVSSRVLDTVAYTNLARAIHFVAKDPADPDRKLFLPGPASYAGSDVGAIAYTIEERQVKTMAGKTITTAVAIVEKGTVDVTPEEVVSVAAKKRGPAASKVRVEMTEWLFDRLKGDGLPVAAGVLFNEAADAFADRKPNPMGVKDPKTGFWTKGRFLYRCAEDIKAMPYPDQGWHVDRYKDPSQSGKAYWQLVKDEDKQGGKHA